MKIPSNYKTMQLRRYQQQIHIQVTQVKNAKFAWAAYGDYWQRENAQVTGKRGIGFKRISEVDLKSLLNGWQHANDSLFYKVLVIPINGHHLDLNKLARQVMIQLESYLSTKLEWAAIDHNISEYPHLHLIIRCITKFGSELKTSLNQLYELILKNSQTIATHKLGKITFDEAMNAPFKIEITDNEFVFHCL